jgi:hypothetical protein
VVHHYQLQEMEMAILLARRLDNQATTSLVAPAAHDESDATQEQAPWLPTMDSATSANTLAAKEQQP